MHRNHAFELCADVVSAYATFGQWLPHWLVGPYDDSLSFDVCGDAEAEVLWLDLERYVGRLGPDELDDWLTARVAHLRSLSSAPILVVTVPPPRAALAECLSARAGVYVCSMTEFAADPSHFDEARAEATGTRISARGLTELGRLLGARWLPAALLPPLKAIVCDLDGTLYEGVLGEDGIDGVRLTESHRALQAWLAEQVSRGLFLAVASRNEPQDVAAMFERRKDFPLRPDHFSTMQVSWGEKASAVVAACERLRIGVDAAVLLDDNPGELVSCTAALPALKTVHAKSDAALTLAALRWFPGLWRWASSRTDQVRVKDLGANEERSAALAAATSLEDYFRSLDVTLRFDRDSLTDHARLAELCVKTNQFNLSLARTAAVEVERAIESPDSAVVGISLRDRLSDSGIIGVLLARREGGELRIAELCVSCRALGRKLEDAIVCGAIRETGLLDGIERVAFDVEIGPRNGPAREWLAKFCGAPEPSDRGVVRLPLRRILDTSVPPGVTIER